MKKNFCKVRRGHCLSLVWIVSFLLWGNVTMAALPIQEAKLSIQQRSVALSRVFYEIEKQTGYSFLVRNNDINMNEKVSIDVKNKSVEEVYLANLHTSFLCNLIYPTFSRILLYSC